jgi:hypothetical protein
MMNEEGIVVQITLNMLNTKQAATRQLRVYDRIHLTRDKSHPQP